jgi:hypothetical protein
MLVQINTGDNAIWQKVESLDKYIRISKVHIERCGVQRYREAGAVGSALMVSD